MQKVLITGAAGNLGGFLAEYLKNEDLTLHLMIHKKDVAPDLKGLPNVNIFRADLNDSSSLKPALQGVDTIVHFAGVLFKHNPGKFLPRTNTKYFMNLLQQAIIAQVKRIILISFPHVEGESFPQIPATGEHYGVPTSVHARTRQEEERALFGFGKFVSIEAVSLRVGMVYGRGVLMIDGARWFAKHRMLGVWKDPTWIHLISLPDFLESTKQAILRPGIKGIYHLGDEGEQTLQQFLDAASEQWGYKRPWRMPLGLIRTAAFLFEMASLLFGIKSPLTRDFVKIGMVSYYGDTSRMRKELLPELKYKTIDQGIGTL
ncbi:MAG: NAD-dependent epimerase/dehydratase family protein [Bacteroidota bacterium]